MSWDRSIAAPALVNTVTVALGGTVTCFVEPPTTVNPPAVVVGGASGLYATAAFAVDELDLDVAVIAGFGHLNDLDGLAEQVRRAVVADPTLGGQVKSAYPFERRNHRNLSIAGTDVSALDLVIRVVM